MLHPRALAWTGVRHLRRGRRWRLCAGDPHGGHQPPFHRRLPRHQQRASTCSWRCWTTISTTATRWASVPRKITWPRTMDMNDRALRDIVVGLGGINGGVPRQYRCDHAGERDHGHHGLSSSAATSKTGSAGGYRGGDAGQACRRADLKAEGSMAPPAPRTAATSSRPWQRRPRVLHYGPFGNIAHGCNSMRSRPDTALKLADLVITEAGFGPISGRRSSSTSSAARVPRPDAVDYRGHGPGAEWRWREQDRLRHGQPEGGRIWLPESGQHIENLQQYGIPVIVALNRFVHRQCRRTGR